MPFKTFNNWLFDGNFKSRIPTGEGVPDLLKYNSPITNQYMITMFINQGKLNHFLNEYFNNMGLYYLEKEEFMRFMKKCVVDFKIQRKNIPYIPIQRNGKLFDALRKKISILKSHDVNLLAEIVDKLENKDQIYYSLGLEKMEPVKKIKGIKKITKKEKPTVKEFIESSFKVMELNNKKN